MIIALIIFFDTLALKLFRDAWLHKNGKKNKHTVGPALVVIALAACTWLAGWLSAPVWLFSWWAIFDPAYALLIGKHPFYLGTTAKLDRLQHKYPVVVLFKYLGAAASIILSIIKVT